MPPKRPVLKHSWLWPVLFVTALHLLSTAGTWWITDHGETLTVANRFLSTGRFDLRDLGPGSEDWARIVAARASSETRFLPLSILALTPFLALDHLIGWKDPASFHFVHLQGHLFVSLGLALVGRFAARTAGGASGAALAVLLLGLNWPVWMIARRIGPEPVLFLLLSIFAIGGVRSRIIVLVLLPWLHATGPILGLAALMWMQLERRADRPSMTPVLGAWIAGVVSLVILWNLPVHGQAFLGGYGRFASDPTFTLRNPVMGVLSVLTSIVGWTFPLWWLAAFGGRSAAFQTLALWILPVGLLGLLSHPSLLANPEPERRLAPLLAAWTVAVISQAPPVKPNQALGLATLALASGVFGLSRDFVDTVSTPLGVYSGPFLLLVRLAFLDHQPLMASSLLILLLAAAWVTGTRALTCLLNPADEGAGHDPLGAASRDRHSGTLS